MLSLPLRSFAFLNPVFRSPSHGSVQRGECDAEGYDTRICACSKNIFHSDRGERMKLAKRRLFCGAVARAPRLGVSCVAQDGFSTKPKNSSRFFNTEAQSHRGTEVLMKMRTYRLETRVGRLHLKGESVWPQQEMVKFQFLCASVPLC